MKIEIVDKKGNSDIPMIARRMYNTDGKESLAESMASDKCSLARHMRRKVIAKSYDNIIDGQAEGDDFGDELYKLGIKVAGKRDTNVWTQCMRTKSKSISVMQTLDSSGSMGSARMTGSMMHRQIKAAAEVDLSFQAVGVRTGMCMYTERWDRLVMVDLKGFEERVNRMKLYRRMLTGCSMKNQNADGEALLWSYEKIKKEDVDRRIILMYSDGTPCGDRSGNNEEFLRTCIKSVTKRGVEVYGIGMGGGGVKEFYAPGKFITLGRDDDFSNKMIMLFDLIQRGGS